MNNKVNGDQVLRNPDVLIPLSEACYWRLLFKQSGGWIGQQTPSLGLGWVPHRVIWNVRGSAPFTVQAEHQPRVTNAVMLYELMPERTAEEFVKLPKVGLQVSQTHISPTQSAWVYPPNYKRWLLWAGLLIAVLVLARMAWSLLKASQPTKAQC